MDFVAITALLCTLGSTSTVHGQKIGLATSVRACSADDAVACDRLEKRLEALFIGRREDSYRGLAHRLAAAAIKVLHDEAAPHTIVAPIARCAANDADACTRIANVLAGLFTGSDAQLDASRDRVFARAFAKRLVSEVHP